MGSCSGAAGMTSIFAKEPIARFVISGAAALGRFFGWIERVKALGLGRFK
jgi:hypothetical protein